VPLLTTDGTPAPASDALCSTCSDQPLTCHYTDEKPSSVPGQVHKETIMSNNSVVRWLDAPEDHDYPAAASYLSLLATPGQIEAVIAALKAHQR
jgi:hypothetical protein